jgi:hypothetical protein
VTAWLLALLELVTGAHCARLVTTPNGPRCAVVVETGRCVIDGWHHAAFGVPVCTRGCGDWLPGEQVVSR